MSSIPQGQRPVQSHTRSSSFFSFRKDSPQRSNSMLSRSNGNGEPASPPPPSSQPQSLHPEIKSVLSLTVAHAHKIYYSGPLIRRIERQPDGQRPTKDEGWTDVWAQLNGTILSVWDMKQVQEASAQGKEVPPTYVNTTDAFVQVLGSVTVPSQGDTPSKRYANVLTLNTAGSNLLLFSCPSTAALISWAAALRLSAWEKSRLEEIYTAHLIRITLAGRDIPSALARGRLEGWARIRVAGQTDWKKLWLIVSGDHQGDAQAPGSQPHGPGRKKRMSNLFNRDTSPTRSTSASPMISVYASPKPKDRKRPILTVADVTQAFAVYPERPELINKSTLIKVEGLMGDEDGAGAMKTREGWLFIMPELEGNMSPSAEMLKWIVALHDAFGLYGRPQAWTWDPREPLSLMFGYPVGPQKELLFLDREAAEKLDPRDDRTSVIRSQLLNILADRMRDMNIPGMPTNHPSLEQQGPVDASTTNGQSPHPTSSGPQLPPLSFDNINASREAPDRRLLTPITEQSSVMTHGRTLSIDGQSMLGSQSIAPRMSLNAPSTVPEEGSDSQSRSPTFLDGSLTQSPAREESELPPIPQEQRNTVSPGPTFGRPSLESNGPVQGKSSLDSSLDPSNIQLPPSIPVSPSSERSPPLRTLSASTSPSMVSRTTHSANSIQPTSSQSPPPSISGGVPPRSHSPASVLTSPHSINEGGSVTHSSVLTSPYSEKGHGTFGQSFSSAPARPSIIPPTQNTLQSSSAVDFSNEAGALYYMQFADGEASISTHSHIRRVPTTINETDRDEEDESDTEDRQLATASPKRPADSSSQSPPRGSQSPSRQNTPMAFDRAVADDQNRTSPTSRLGLGRKPSGARAQATARFNPSRLASHQPLQQPQSVPEAPRDEEEQDRGLKSKMEPMSTTTNTDDTNLDALAALSYLDVNEDQVPPAATSTKPVEPLRPRPVEPQRPVGATPSPPPPAPAEGATQYKSSFAPSKHAAERKAKVQAQQAAQQAAAHRPGRGPNGKKKMRAVNKGTWNESSEEEDEDEEEEDDDDDVDSDAEPPMHKPVSSSNSSVRPPQSQGHGSSDHHTPDFQPHQPQPTYSHLRPPRTLPQIPGPRSQYDNDDMHGMSRRQPSDQHSEYGRRTYYDDGPQIRSQAEFPQPGAARQTVWSQVLDPAHSPGAAPEPVRDTFVQLEPPSQTMTKAFTPQGLLSAGLQDKQDRSAKRQEELARESGASLINVPNKPPPPQTGLLGAITAHERERKREGGVGAALTEREREKRLAEERQRRFDDHQRQQLDQMQQGGSMYGFNPMMNPMMMGMNPMMGMHPMITGGGMAPVMTGGGMNPMMTGGMNPMMTGFPGMMPGYNPQQLFAAQQAAQAYQQAMMAFSVAGSQVGDGGNSTPPQLNPMMSGNMNFDPRMSMMGMPVMGGMPMQMTGMSTFDPRFPPSNSLTPNNESGPQGGQYQSNSSSPAGRGSPLARPSDQNDGPRQPPRTTSPKP